MAGRDGAGAVTGSCHRVLSAAPRRSRSSRLAGDAIGDVTGSVAEARRRGPSPPAEPGPGLREVAAGSAGTGLGMVGTTPEAVRARKAALTRRISSPWTCPQVLGKQRGSFYVSVQSMSPGLELQAKGQIVSAALEEI